MNAVTVIGVGSPFGVDRLGWQAVENLKRDHALQTWPGERVKLISCDRPGVMLLDYMQGADYAILIDAVEGGIAGSIREISKQRLLDLLIEHSSATAGNHMSSHDIGVLQAVELGSRLGILPERLELYGIETGDDVSTFQVNSRQIAELSHLVFNHIQQYLSEFP